MSLAQDLAKATELPNATVQKVLAALASYAKHCVKKRDCTLVIPGVCRIKTVHKKATKARTAEIFGETKRIKAKPAGRRVKAYPAKALKDAI